MRRETSLAVSSAAAMSHAFAGVRSYSRLRLGEYEFDVKAGELCHAGRRTVLQSQPHKILVLLVEQPGEVVTRDEIQQRLWPGDVIVNFEVGINQAIRKLRQALDDCAASPRFIETVGRRGYRLKVPVAVSETPVIAEPSRAVVQLAAREVRTEEFAMLVGALLQLLRLTSRESTQMHRFTDLL